MYRNERNFFLIFILNSTKENLLLHRTNLQKKMMCRVKLYSIVIQLITSYHFMFV
jgi:hypothetical protein